MAEYWCWPSYFFGMLMDWDGVESINTLKKEWAQYQGILTRKARSIKNLLFAFQGNFSCGTRWVVPSGQDGSVLPTWVANHSAGFDPSCRLMELAILLQLSVLDFPWWYGWNCLLLIEFTHKVTPLLWVWRIRLQVTQTLKTALHVWNLTTLQLAGKFSLF